MHTQTKDIRIKGKMSVSRQYFIQIIQLLKLPEVRTTSNNTYILKIVSFLLLLLLFIYFLVVINGPMVPDVCVCPSIFSIQQGFGLYCPYTHLMHPHTHQIRFFSFHTLFSI